MKKWELSRYLIDAKKCVDSIIFISDNIKAITNIDVRDKVNSKRNSFYINCCVVLDKSFPKKKKALCDSDEIAKELYYERDKNSAHNTQSDLEYKVFNDTEDIRNVKQNDIDRFYFRHRRW